MKNVWLLSKIKHLCSPAVGYNATRQIVNSPKNIREVVGLSNNVLKDPCTKVGPNADKEGKYKNPEYFWYHKLSYFEAEIELSKYRLPQPVSKNN